MTGPCGLLGILEEGEFSEAWDVIGTLQRTISAEPLSFAKEVIKASEGSPKKSITTTSGKAPEALKDSKKRVRGVGLLFHVIVITQGNSSLKNYNNL